MHACCPLCDKLAPAREVGQQLGTRARTYKVGAHNANGCPECGEVTRFVLGSDLGTGVYEYECRNKHRILEDQIVTGPRCTGDTKEIR